MSNKKDLGYIIHESYVKGDKLMIIKQTKETVTFKATIQDFYANRNKRKYTKEWLSKCLNAPHIRELKATNNWFGEAGHPLDKSLDRQTIIDNERISHLILETYITDTSVEADIITSMNKHGIELRDNIIHLGTIPAFSMRGMGKVEEQGGLAIIKEPGRIITYDQVIFPSHNRAYGKVNQDENIIDKIGDTFKESMSLSEGLLIPMIFDDANTLLNESDNFNTIKYSNYLTNEAQILIDKKTGNIIITEKNNFTLFANIEEKYKRTKNYRDFMKSL